MSEVKINKDKTLRRNHLTEQPNIKLKQKENQRLKKKTRQIRSDINKEQVKSSEDFNKERTIRKGTQKNKLDKPKVRVKPQKRKENTLKKKVLTPEGEELLETIKRSVFGMFSTEKKVVRKRPVSLNKVNAREGNKNEEPVANSPLYERLKSNAEIQSNLPSSKKRPRKFTYTRVAKHETRKEPIKEVAVEEVKNEKVLMRRAKLETVKDINDVGFFAKIGLVNYFSQKESGKLDDRLVREEYARNTKLLQAENSLKYFLLESAQRNLEYHELPEITIQIDARLREEFEKCLNSKLLASYDIRIEKQNEILTRMNVDPIIISMRLKRVD